jgi:hypothetical protein
MSQTSADRQTLLEELIFAILKFKKIDFNIIFAFLNVATN